MNINTHFAPLKSAYPPVGIDKVIVQTKEFDVFDTHQLTIVPNSKKQGDEEAVNTPLFTCRGHVINGSKAFHNSIDEEAVISANINWAGLSVTYNPSKLMGKPMGELSNIADVRGITSKVEEYLRANGISAPLNSSRIYRLDMAKDRGMNQKVFAYKDVFDVLRAKGYHKKAQYPNGVLIGNRKRQGIFYDKGRELHPRGGDTNIMRGEVRIMSNQTVVKKLGIATLTDLYQTDENYLNTSYNNFISADMFHTQGKGAQYSFDFMSEVSILKSFKEQGRNAFKKYLMLRGVEATMLVVGNMENLRNLLGEVFHRNRVNEYLSEAEELMRMKSIVDGERVTLSSKYEEVRLKFVA